MIHVGPRPGAPGLGAPGDGVWPGLPQPSHYKSTHTHARGSQAVPAIVTMDAHIESHPRLGVPRLSTKQGRRGQPDAMSLGAKRQKSNRGRYRFQQRIKSRHRLGSFVRVQRAAGGLDRLGHLQCAFLVCRAGGVGESRVGVGVGGVREWGEEGNGRIVSTDSCRPRDHFPPLPPARHGIAPGPRNFASGACAHACMCACEPPIQSCSLRVIISQNSA